MNNFKYEMRCGDHKSCLDSCSEFEMCLDGARPESAIDDGRGLATGPGLSF